MEQLLKEMRVYLKLKYSQEIIKQVGLEEDEDVERLLKENRHLENFKPENIIDDYIREQTIANILEAEEI